jgi:hypothetical protein
MQMVIEFISRLSFNVNHDNKPKFYNMFIG